jgi:hypothetical protein
MLARCHAEMHIATQERQRKKKNAYYQREAPTDRHQQVQSPVTNSPKSAS